MSDKVFWFISWKIWIKYFALYFSVVVPKEYDNENLNTSIRLSILVYLTLTTLEKSHFINTNSNILMNHWIKFAFTNIYEFNLNENLSPKSITHSIIHNFLSLFYEYIYKTRYKFLSSWNVRYGANRFPSID